MVISVSMLGSEANTMIPLRLRIEVGDEGGWRLLLVHRDSRGKRGDLDAGAVAALRAGLDRSSADAGPVLLVPGDDVEIAALELAAGRALAPVLSASPELNRELAFYQGQASSASPILLVISTETPALSAVPWELLCDHASGRHLEESGVTIARLADGRPRPARPLRTTLRNIAWAPAGDEMSSVLLAKLRASCRAHELSPPERLADAPPLGPEEAAVLHLMLHGAVADDQIALLVDDERRGAGGITQQLRAWLGQVDLVVLSICESGAALTEELDGLVSQLIQAGAPAVVAPAGELSVAAAATFGAGLLGALAAGQPMPAAVTSGRRAVRALALPYPDARWHNLQLTVADLNRTEPLVRQGWRPAGWPRPGAEVGPLLIAAKAIAADSGFVGVEHLLLALGALTDASPLGMLPRLIRSNRARIEKRLALLSPDPACPPDDDGTPRLQSLGAALQPGFPIEALWQAMLAELGPVLAWHLSSRLRARPSSDADVTQRPESDIGLDTDGRVVALEVLGGPECGRRLRFEPGARIGRWRAGAERQRCAITLFERTPLRDQTLSRSGVLWWRAPDLVEPLVPNLQLHRGTEPSVILSPGSPLWLHQGDRLQLSHASWLLACGPRP